MTPATLLKLPLGERSYEIHIGTGLLPRLGELVRTRVGEGRAAVVTNTTVAPLYLEQALASLAAAGLDPSPIVLPDGESFKNWETLNLIFDGLITHRYERSATVIALGGGVVGDMSGYAAASFLRGVNYVQAPTTLLAQVDSSVGGKTGINHPLGKNLIGAFHQPRLVVAELSTLATLPVRELRAGLAEVIKYGVIRDEALFSYLEGQLEGVLALDEGVLTRVVRASCAIKAEIVAADEREGGQRALLNLGHTFGHAIETLTSYTGYLHGEAVAVGMVMAADLSWRMGLCGMETVTRLKRLLERAGLPVAAPRFPVAAYLDAMARDKKVAAGQVRFVLPKGIGQAVIRGGAPVEKVAETLQWAMGG